MQKHPIISIRNEDMMMDIDFQGFTHDFYDIYKARSTYFFLKLNKIKIYLPTINI
jgi:hypothetical protein